MNLLVNSQRLLVDCHVVHASKVWLLRERTGETIRRNCAACPQERKPAAAEAGRAKPEVAELLLADAIGALPALRLE